LPTVALAKAGRRFGWQAGASLGPQALLISYLLSPVSCLL
jgi:hypothetical protein